jgi:MAF protein
VTRPISTLVLASASARRRWILRALGVPFEAIAVDVDETPRRDEAPEMLAGRLAAMKAQAGSARHPDAAVLGADTVVALDDETLGKPIDADEAVEMLRRLRGRAHRVVTAVALACPPEAADGVLSKSATTTVWMRNYADAEIDEYVATGDSFDKAGSYAIQHPRFRPVERIQGCFLNVVGLPLPEVWDLLRAVGVHSKLDSAALDAICPGCADRELLLH